MGSFGQAVQTEVGLVQCAWTPQLGPQTALITCPIFECFFGGARGGGKTDGMLGDFAYHASLYGLGAKGVFFRRKWKQLEDAISRARSIYVPLGAKYNKSSSTFTFPNGATLKFRHLWDAGDADSYQGHAYSWVCFEEITQWADPTPVDLLRATLRPTMPGVKCYFRATGNPGGPGHNWVKARYVSPAPRGMTPIYDPETQSYRVFIPSRLEDNKLLMANDPNYERRLLATGNASLVRAWRWGDWDIVAGGFLDDIWNPDVHVIEPFEIPACFSLRRSFDWGAAKPASLGLWAVSDGTPLDSGHWFPRGSLIRVGEWYTCEREKDGSSKPNVGLRLNNEQLGRGIAQMSEGSRWSGCVADPSIFTEQGGPSIYEQLRKGARTASHNLVFGKADNDRRAGWAQLRTMLENAADEQPEDPGLWIFDSCEDWLRTVPVIQRDEKNGDDVDSDGEDHCADETRYACMTRARKASSQEFRL